MTNFKNVERGERIPLARVTSHVQDWIDMYYGVGGGTPPSYNENPYFTAKGIRAEHPEWTGASESIPIMVLADATGLSPNNIGTWMRSKNLSATIGYFDADALFAGMDRIDLWARDPELRDIRDACIGADLGILPDAPRSPSGTAATLPEAIKEEME